MEAPIMNEPGQNTLEPKLLKWNTAKDKYTERVPEMDESDQDAIYFSGLRIKVQQGPLYFDPGNDGPNIAITKIHPNADGIEISYKFNGREPTTHIVGRTIMQTQPTFSLSNPEMLEELSFSLPKTDGNKYPDILILKVNPEKKTA
jgi:hypothetical protein